jgi:hypothetical protein
LILTFLLLALVWSASAQARTAGVAVSSTFKYGVTVSWSSNDPSATPLSSLEDANATQWIQLAVTDVSGTNVTEQLTTNYKNGTDITNDGWVDVDTGGGNLTIYFISADLSPGDSIYTTVSPYNTWTINETVSRTYASGARDTNHVNVTTASTSSLGNISIANNLYWDKSTGVLVELSAAESNQTGAYLTTWSEDLQISDSNVWTVPEFPTWTATLIMLIALTSVTILISRQRQHRRPLR